VKRSFNRPADLLRTAGHWQDGQQPPYRGLVHDIDHRGKVFKQMALFRSGSSQAPSQDQLRRALAGVKDPASGRDLVAAGLVGDIAVRDGLVQVSLYATRETAAAMEPACRDAERALAAVPGVKNAAVVLTAHKDAPATPTAAPAASRPLLLPNVRAVIAVASGKGGVGKSTTAVNLAVSLARMGLRIGLLDADIYGPSLPRMLGLSGKPVVKEGRMIPLDAWGLKAMSIGFLVEEETPMIWRGPMVMGALEQMMGQVEWGELDAMIVDMPPGTGDAQLTMAQRVSLAGAVIVSTPQDVALIDARRGVRMFERTAVPVLGLIENMSFFCCPNCNHTTPIFGHGGAKAEAGRLGVEFLGEVPILLDIRTNADAGTPIAAADPDGVAGQAFASIARRLWEKVSNPKSKSGPKIVIE
jgi:ATP-binding protein involved in chromosome partitioning